MRELQVLGTFLPLLGLVVTFVIAYRMPPGTGRRLVLLIGPAATLALCMAFAEFIGANGNMLFIALLLMLWIFAFAYYPILVGYWAIRTARGHRGGQR